jgi:hypothetical protein
MLRVEDSSLRCKTMQRVGLFFCDNKGSSRDVRGLMHALMKGSSAM